MRPATSSNGIPNRRKPDDFEIAFIELGRVQCEVFYRAGRATITRWLEESGKRRLLDQRKKFLKAQRAAEVAERRRSRERLAPEPRRPQPGKIAPPADADDEILHLAARWLQRRAAGGWVVYELPDRWWMVGTIRRTPQEMLDKALAKGFDLDRAQRQIAAFPGNIR